MTQPDLFDVPEQLSPRLIAQRKFDAFLVEFKKRNDIWTHYNEDCEYPWSGMCFDRAIEEFDEEYVGHICDPVELIAEFAQDLEDRDLLAYGRTEIEVIFALSKRHRLVDTVKLQSMWEECQP